MDKNKKDNFKQFNFENFNQTTEEDVGIIEFVNKENEGFECVLKHRYSDFIVNEINEEGKVIWLKNPNNKQEIIKDDELRINNNDEEQSNMIQQIDNKNNDVSIINDIQEKPNKKKFVLKTELVEDIIKNHFVNQQILDEEDGIKLRDLIIKYNER